jgi:hypothetical protein
VLFDLVYILVSIAVL